MSAQKIAAVTLDLACFALGAFILVHEEWSGRASEFLILAGVALCAGIPAVRSLFALRAGGKQLTVSISDSSSPSASPGSPLPSSPPSGSSP